MAAPPKNRRATTGLAEDVLSQPFPIRASTSPAFSNLNSSAKDSVRRLRYAPETLALLPAPHPNDFDKLPIEITQRVAMYIQSDRDLCSFVQSCRSASSAVNADNLSFWRRRFFSVFEKPRSGQLKNNQFRAKYIERKRALAISRFGTGSQGEDKSLKVIIDLLMDSFSEKAQTQNRSTYESANLQLVCRLTSESDLLQIVCKSPKLRRRINRAGDQCDSPYLQLLQILLAPRLLSLDEHFLDYHYDLQLSQYLAFTTAPDCPIVDQFGRVCLKYVLHVLNFWKYHLVQEKECTLFASFAVLPAWEQPKFWSDSLMHPVSEFPKHWKGSYSYIESATALWNLRNGHAEQELVQESFPGEGGQTGFQDLRLELADEDNVVWPAQFEKHLRAFGKDYSPARTRAQSHRAVESDETKPSKPVHVHIIGDGEDQKEDFQASGWLRSLRREDGMPGFCRVVLMKYWKENGIIDFDGLWAYEGVMLPGCRIILGRWWSPHHDDAMENMYSGPFILWAVDGVEDEKGEQ